MEETQGRRGRRSPLDPSQMPIGQPQEIILDGRYDEETGTRVEAITKDALNKQYLDELSFMEEYVDIIIQADGRDNTENPVPIGCNGVFVYVEREKPVTIKRKFVNNLIVKTSRVSTPEFINGAGERAFKVQQMNSLKYPFMVLRDPNPKGGEWLARKMAEAV